MMLANPVLTHVKLLYTLDQKKSTEGILSASLGETYVW